MSFFTVPIPRPVVADQVWEYLGSSLRTGRFWVRKEIRKDFWETTELSTGADRNYYVNDILTSAALTHIQPGQSWHDTAKRLCKIVRPYAARWSSWIVEREGAEIGHEIDEAVILKWTLIAGAKISGPAKPVYLCPLCGTAGLPMIMTFDCESSSCRNFSNRRGTGKPSWEKL